jgi:hypothetical protein
LGAAKRCNVTPSTEIAPEKIGDALHVKRITAIEDVDLVEHVLAVIRHQMSSEQQDRFIAARSCCV